MTLPLLERLPSGLTVEACAARLGARPWFTWLDSGSDAAGLGRWSFLCAEPWAALRALGMRTERRGTDGTWQPVAGDLLTALDRELTPLAVAPAAGGPPFQGGAAGYIGYDWGRVLEPRIPAASAADLGLPDAMFGLYDVVIAWDHQSGEGWIVSTGDPATGTARETHARTRLAEVLQWLAAPASCALGDALLACPGPLDSHTGAAPSYPVIGVEDAEFVQLRSTFTHRGYLSAVQRVREYILAGDIFQANLSQRFQAPLPETPGRLYARLRHRNPAPFGAWLSLDDVTLLSVSPERFLRLDGRAVETRPIKGTRPRGLGPMHDEALGKELTESEKDRAENLMIVDLLRNDLSRVCAPGTVRVPELFHLEQHPTVLHLVSTVTGMLRPEYRAADLLRVSFPGGSITGAPKIRAMQLLERLEPVRRGPYTGIAGWLGPDGSMATSILIRTFVADGERLSLHVGGGITWRSDPAAEWDETVAKARGPLSALGAREVA
ncbi:MAG: aminodeoxychorismate synthase component I [Gemmatimonadales bacterium]